MTKRIGLMFSIGVVMGLALSVSAAYAGNRPTGAQLDTLSKGEPHRDLNTLDGGGFSFWTIDAGIGCNLVATGALYELHCDSDGHFCPWTDGGCSFAIESQAYGRPFKASTPAAPNPYVFMTESSSTPTKQVCVMPASGDATITCAAFRMK